MTEIEQTKESILRSKGAIAIMTEVNILQYFITTIESQKGEIEKLKSWVYKLQDAHQIEQFNLNAEIESLKAITELAVKGLKEIASGGFWNADRYIEIAQNSLSEIARSAHEQT